MKKMSVLTIGLILFTGSALANPPIYGATAAGTRVDGDRVTISIGMGAGNSMDEAVRIAVTSCNNNSYGISCAEVGSGFSHGGCGFMTSGTGKNSNGVGRVSYGVGGTKQKAFNNCVSQGRGETQCRTDVIGFCTGK